MGRLLMGAGWGIVLAISLFAGMVDGQAMQATTTPPTNNTDPSNPVAPRNDSAPVPNANDPAPPVKEAAAPAKDSAEPIEEATEPTVDPASLLPDLPPLRPAKASLIGGTVNKLDRVKDVLTIQVFGGGKMKIAFDTRTHFYNNTAAGTASDLKKGDRIYIDTVLDGSTVFAKTIRVKSVNTAAGESNGTVVSYRADKGILELRDMLSPETLKIHITPQTRIIEGDHASSSGKLIEGSLVAVKFGAQKEGDVASEVSILAVPGAQFTFAGTVTAVDRRLGILVLDSSVDHKTYEVSLDASLIPSDDSLRAGVDVTVLSRFDGTKYVARTVTVNPPQQH